MRIVRGTIVLGAALAVLAAVATTASADPSPAGTYPATSDLSAVGEGGSDLLGDQLSGDYNAGTSSSVPPRFYSFDHVNPSTGAIGDTIYPKDDTVCGTARPLSTGAGIARLQARQKTLDGHYCVDLARSARLLAVSDGTGIAGLIYARGLLGMATVAGGNGVANLTDTELKALYTCNASLMNVAYSGPVTWKELGGTSTDQVVPVLPGQGTDTTEEFMRLLGLTFDDPLNDPYNIGPCVVAGASPVNGSVIDQNEGTNSVFTSAFAAYKDDLVPYEAADYACQVYTGYCPDTAGALTLIDVDGKAPLTSSHLINISGLIAYPVLYIHGEYMVLRNAGTATAPAVPAYLQAFLGNGNNAGWLCSTAAATDIRRYGFAPASNCGALFGQ